MSDERNIAQRHRFGSDYVGPLTFRQFRKEANWVLIAVILACLGFWGYVIYGFAQWWPL